MRNYKGVPGNRGRSACGPTHVARLEFPRETGLILRCAGKAGNPFQTTQGNRLSCRDQEGRRGSEEAVPGPSVFPSGEPGVSGDFWGSQEGCQGPSRPSGRNRGLPLRRRRGQGPHLAKRCRHFTNRPGEAAPEPLNDKKCLPLPTPSPQLPELRTTNFK